MTGGGWLTGRTGLTGWGRDGAGKLNCDCCKDGEVIWGGLWIIGIAPEIIIVHVMAAKLNKVCPHRTALSVHKCSS